MIIKTKFDESMKYASNDVSITQRGDGRYQCRIMTAFEIDENGKKCNYKYKFIYGVDHNDVLIKRAEFIEEQIKVQTQTQITSELLTTKLHEWLYVHKRNSIKPNAFDRLESTYKYQVLTALTNCNLIGIRLKDVTLSHIQQIMNWNFERGYSYSTLKKTRNLLREFFQFAEDDISKNPMRKYKLFQKDVVIEKQQSMQADKAAALTKIQQQKAEIAKDGVSKIYVTEDEQHLARLKLTSQTSEKDIHVFTDEEIQKLEDVIANGYRLKYTSRSGNEVTRALYFPKQGSFFLFMLNSGLRAGEAVALKYSDFDFENGTVKIHRNAVNVKQRSKDGTATGKRNRNFTTPKTAKSDDVLQLSPYAIEIILAMKAKEPASYGDFVIHSDYKPLAEKALWQRLDKLLRGAGIEPCGLHSLRHTYGTKLYEATQDLKFVAQQLRHTDPSFTARTYVHQSDKRTKEILCSIKI